jgi:hypothetical protein
MASKPLIIPAVQNETAEVGFHLADKRFANDAAEPQTSSNASLISATHHGHVNPRTRHRSCDRRLPALCRRHPKVRPNSCPNSQMLDLHTEIFYRNSENVPLTNIAFCVCLAIRCGDENIDWFVA